MIYFSKQIWNKKYFLFWMKNNFGKFLSNNLLKNIKITPFFWIVSQLLYLRFPYRLFERLSQIHLRQGVALPRPNWTVPESEMIQKIVDEFLAFPLLLFLFTFDFIMLLVLILKQIMIFPEEIIFYNHHFWLLHPFMVSFW